MKILHFFLLLGGSLTPLWAADYFLPAIDVRV